ncbi:hypothetical protein BST12_14280 [Mycobacterium angelicum]|uniref:Uncharacterized protein n=2 Tax=Mycobacterium angelicum TaxID=470074 RepID=A0A1W9ZSL4_MYCAN|nr:hypothetical protein BST12_14280 [Mycobacterium angelicum]
MMTAFVSYTAEPNVTIVQHNPVPDALQIAAACGTALGALGVIAAVATFWFQWFKSRREREDRKTRDRTELQRHEAQIAVLRQAEDDRLAAQARRIVPAIFRGDVVSNTLWNLRVDNWSTDVVSDMKIDIIICDRAGNTVPHGYRLANRAGLAETMINIFTPVFSQVMDALAVRFNQYIEAMKATVMSLPDPNDTTQIDAINAQFAAGLENMGPQLNEQTAANLQAQVNHAVQTRLTDEWQTILAPGQFTAMAIETTQADYRPHLQIQFEDASGYRWGRTDTEGPKRIHEGAQRG